MSSEVVLAEQFILVVVLELLHEMGDALLVAVEPHVLGEIPVEGSCVVRVV